jgi:hypothetical protein
LIGASPLSTALWTFEDPVCAKMPFHSVPFTPRATGVARSSGGNIFLLLDDFFGRETRIRDMEKPIG